jgi:hypothetical protein
MDLMGMMETETQQKIEDTKKTFGYGSCRRAKLRWSIESNTYR